MKGKFVIRPLAIAISITFIGLVGLAPAQDKPAGKCVCRSKIPELLVLY